MIINKSGCNFDNNQEIIIFSPGFTSNDLK